MTDSARWCERCKKWGDHHTDRHDECAPATAAREPWTRHAWDESHKHCVECHHEWPCDIAKAWRGGYEWAETQQRLRGLHEQLGARNGT